MRLAIIVVNFGSSHLLAHNLVATARSVSDALVIVCDNFSADTEAQAVRDLADTHGWVVLASPVNIGFGDAVNLASDYALKADATDLLILNPDASTEAESVSALAAVAARNRTSLIAPVVRTTDGRVWFNGADLDLADGRTRASRKRAAHPDAEFVPWLSGACLWVPAEMWTTLAGFGGDYFLYWEDIDLSWRALQAGAELIVVPDATAIHDAGGTQASTGHRGKSRVYYYYNVRNRLLFAARNLDDAVIRRWLRSTRAVSWEILMRGGRAQLLTDPGVLWAMVRGMRDGRRIAAEALRRS